MPATTPALPQLFFHGHRRPYGSVFEEWSRHSPWQANATMRCGIRRNIALVHRIAAPEEHSIWHLRTVEVRARWLAVLARINVEPHDVAIIIHVIAEYGGDVVCILRENLIIARRGGEPRFAGRDGRFADEMFPFVKVSFLLTDMNDDFRGPGDACVIPPTGRTRGITGSKSRLFRIGWNFFAA